MEVYLRDKEISLLDRKQNGNGACHCNKHSGTLLANYWHNTRTLGEASKMLDAFALGMFVACDQPRDIFIITPIKQNFSYASYYAKFWQYFTAKVSILGDFLNLRRYGNSTSLLLRPN